MGPYCCCSGCNERYVKGTPYTFHTFPKDEQRAKLWLQKMNREDFVPTSYSKVCSKHFTKDCFYRQKNGAIWLKSYAVPTVFDFPKMQKEDRGGRKSPAKRKTRVSRFGVKASSQDHTELLESIQRKFVPILPAPDTTANRVWCILVPVVPKPGEIQPGSERTANGTTTGGESNNKESDSDSDKMPVCHTVNLKEAFADTFVKEELVGDRDESVCSAPEGDYENSLAEEESRQDRDTSAFSTTKESWQDWRNDVESKAFVLRKKTGSGTSSNVKPVTPLEEKLISFLGPCVISGHEEVPDPLTIRHQDSGYGGPMEVKQYVQNIDSNRDLIVLSLDGSTTVSDCVQTPLISPPLALAEENVPSASGCLPALHESQLCPSTSANTHKHSVGCTSSRDEDPLVVKAREQLTCRRNQNDLQRETKSVTRTQLQVEERKVVAIERAAEVFVRAMKVLEEYLRHRRENE